MKRFKTPARRRLCLRRAKSKRSRLQRSKADVSESIFCRPSFALRQGWSLAFNTTKAEPSPSGDMLLARRRQEPSPSGERKNRETNK
jgi:hypothetical protein